MEQPRVALMGLPGSGKGTQARALASHLDVPIVGVGDLLRREVAEKTDFGQKVAPILARGGMPDERVVSEFVFTRLPKSGFVLDGFPRSVVQYHLLRERCSDQAMHVLYVFLDVPREVALQRLLARRICLACGVNVSENAHACVACGEKQLGQRQDDAPDVIKNRMQDQVQKAKEVLSCAQGASGFFAIDATQPQDQVTREIERIIASQELALQG